MRPVEHIIFDAARQQQSTMGVYAMGTFLNTNPEDLDRPRTQLYPTEGSRGYFNALREKLNLPLFDDDYFEAHRMQFITNTLSVQATLTNHFHHTLTTLGEGAELLDTVGNVNSNHTLQLTELVDERSYLYYAFAGGFPMIEAKSDELLNYTQNHYQSNVFTYNQAGQITYNRRSLELFVLALISDYFKREITPDQVVDTIPARVVNSHFFRKGDLFATDDPKVKRLVLVTNVRWTPQPS